MVKENSKMYYERFNEMKKLFKIATLSMIIVTLLVIPVNAATTYLSKDEVQEQISKSSKMIKKLQKQYVSQREVEANGYTYIASANIISSNPYIIEDLDTSELYYVESEAEGSSVIVGDKAYDLYTRVSKNKYSYKGITCKGITLVKVDHLASNKILKKIKKYRSKITNYKMMLKAKVITTKLDLTVGDEQYWSKGFKFKKAPNTSYSVEIRNKDIVSIDYKTGHIKALKSGKTTMSCTCKQSGITTSIVITVSK